MKYVDILIDRQKYNSRQAQTNVINGSFNKNWVGKHWRNTRGWSIKNAKNERKNWLLQIVQTSPLLWQYGHQRTAKMFWYWIKYKSKMFGIKNITAVEIDQLPYQKLPWYGHYWYGKIDQMVISKDDNKKDNIMMMVMIWLKKKRSVICGWVGARVRLRKHNVWRHPLFPSHPSPPAFFSFCLSHFYHDYDLCMACACSLDDFLIYPI